MILPLCVLFFCRGLPCPTNDVLIMDPKTRKSVPVGQVGEVWMYVDLIVSPLRWFIAQFFRIATDSCFFSFLFSSCAMIRSMLIDAVRQS